MSKPPGNAEQTDQPRPQTAVTRRVGRWDDCHRQRNAKYADRLYAERLRSEERSAY